MFERGVTCALVWLYHSYGDSTLTSQYMISESPCVVVLKTIHKLPEGEIQCVVEIQLLFECILGGIIV